MKSHQPHPHTRRTVHSLFVVGPAIALIIATLVVVLFLFAGNVFVRLHPFNVPTNTEPGTQEERSEQPTIPAGGLGVEGAICGGEERFPCSPGLICETANADWTKTYGTCVKDTREPQSPSGEGGPCSEMQGCKPGFRCDRKPSEPVGTCVGVTRVTPPPSAPSLP